MTHRVISLMTLHAAPVSARPSRSQAHEQVFIAVDAVLGKQCAFGQQGRRPAAGLGEEYVRRPYRRQLRGNRLGHARLRSDGSGAAWRPQSPTLIAASCCQRPAPRFRRRIPAVRLRTIQRICSPLSQLRLRADKYLVHRAFADGQCDI